jgi:ATP-dependent Clp protease ATP-binding subunit ClpA
VIVDLLAQKIASGEVPDFLKEKKILKINLGELLSDSQYRGQFEQKVSALLKEAANPDVLLFIDEIHNIK